MSSDDVDDEFLIEIRQDFLGEATDMIEKAETCFIGFEKDPHNPEYMEEILRLFHSLKGSSFAVGFENLANFSHNAEDFIIAVKNGKIPLSNKVADTLLLCSDIINQALKTLESGQDNADLYVAGHEKIASFSSSDISEKNGKEKIPDANNTADETETKNSEVTGKMSDEEVQRLIAEMDENICDPTVETIKKSSSEITSKNDNNEKNQSIEKSKPVTTDVRSKQAPDISIKVAMNKIDSLLDSLGEQIIWQKKLSYLLNSDIEQSKDEIFSIIHSMEKITLDLQQNSIALRMISLQSTFRRLERVVRETAKNVNKKIEFIVEGENNELDKTIADSLINPLTHMIRNAIDHGIEDESTRIKNGKKIEGVVKLSAYRQGGYFFIDVVDDGKGLDKNLILNKAIEKGIVPKDNNLSEIQIYNLIFSNGFSTKEQATDVSGRGVGMDVVRQMFQSLKGTCEINSQLGFGTRFRVRLPLALALFEGMVLRVGEKQFIIPNSDYKETGEIQLSSIQLTDNQQMIVNYKGKVMPIISLREKFELGKYQGDERCLGAVVPYENNDYILLFDDLVSQERIVLKKLLPNIQKIKGIVGGTILGDGKVALVLETREIVEEFKLGA